MKQVLLYGNGDFVNLGCEAIARGAATILAEKGGYRLSMATYFPDADGGIIRELGATAVKLNRGREGVDNVLFELALRAGLKTFSLKIPHLNAQKLADGMDITFAVGGDNYCYDGCQRYYRLNNGVRKGGGKNVFWACSIEPDSIDAQMIADLNGYDVIFARESLTYEALKRVCTTRVELCSDPAFRMIPNDRELPEILKDKKAKWIGVNLSPLIYKYAKEPEVVRAAVLQSLQSVLDTTDYNLFFFPHVYGEGNDVFINREIAEGLTAESDRIFCFEKRIDAACMKGIVACLDGVICARTHASIAAYSSCVPTFVLGYSVKAKGIAKDIYGTYEGHIMPVQELEDAQVLRSRIEAFVSGIDAERAMLLETIPAYAQRANLNLEDMADA
ncbi:MAG: polysaccharide pyruvyl transferase family protein [Clostridia bacterium]|nr:polysaccharide pyruvyl transferase family protein [Clostridia bacterium]